MSSFPCVTYEAGADLTVKMMSPNVFDLIGIQAEFLCGNRSLWQERAHLEDRDRLMGRLNQLAQAEVASEYHRIINDRGLPVWVAHSFRRVGKDTDIRIRGCLIPLSAEDFGDFVDNAVVSQFVHKIGNHFQLINLLIGSLKRNRVSIDEINVLQETVDRAIDFTRSFSHYTQTPAYLSAIDLGEVLRSLLDSFTVPFTERKIDLRAGLDESVDGALISADPFLLELALSSILQNALEATQAGDRVVMEAKAELKGRPNKAIACISVTDTGCGMETAILAKASTPFFSSKPERNGLGLSMAIRLLEMHGGLVKILSEEKRGTRIDVVLPLSQAGKSLER